MEWTFAQTDSSQELARLHLFSVKKRQPDGYVDFVITVKEYTTPPGGEPMRFVAEADKQTNQSTAPFTPRGWGNTLIKALSECVAAIEKFPYEGPRG